LLGTQVPLLQVNNLKTHFFSDDAVTKAVDGVTYDVEAGETVALVGESGCGKSVSSMSVMQLIPQPPGKIVDGEIIFDGRNLLTLSTEEMRRVRGREIAMIFQEPMTSLNPVINIETQLTEAMTLQLGITPQQAKKKALELLERVGIPEPETRIKQYPHEFSGGMRQRVMVAMALSCEPKLIIADEPTTALDVTIQAQILDLMKDLAAERDMALLIITHNLGVVARYADRINIMYAGRIIERGTCKDIFADPRHPYTLGLLESIPRFDQPKGSKLIPITGQPPNLSDLPPGCSFQPRCRFAAEKCSIEYPDVSDFGNGHISACWEVDNFKAVAESGASK
jgi:oligopeptide/dipeptide ABC transporter ATP-binding protein